VGPLAPGSSGTLENPSCKVSGAGSSASFGVDGKLPVGLSVTFKTEMPEGTKPLWPAASDGVDRSGWVQTPGGTYGVPACTATKLGALLQPLAPEQRTEAVKRFPMDSSEGGKLTTSPRHWC
jgi:hypothetical protein